MKHAAGVDLDDSSFVPTGAGRHARTAAGLEDRATRPKVERKLAHMIGRKHGGRRARLRGTVRVRHEPATSGPIGLRYSS